MEKDKYPSMEDVHKVAKSGTVESFRQLQKWDDELEISAKPEELQVKNYISFLLITADKGIEAAKEKLSKIMDKS